MIKMAAKSGERFYDWYTKAVELALVGGAVIGGQYLGNVLVNTPEYAPEFFKYIGHGLQGTSALFGLTYLFLPKTPKKIEEGN